ncbi:MAG: hypothetical protein U0Q10_14970 [Dermatophilaceae bacterium]
MPELTLPVPVRPAVHARRRAQPGLAATPHSTDRGGVIAADAALTALVLADAGLETVPGICVRRGRGVDFLDPVRVRPVHGGRGPAWSVATSPGELRAALVRAFAVDSHAWVEELAEGRELEQPVVRLADGTCLVGAAHDAGVGTFFAQDRGVGGDAQFTAAEGMTDLDQGRVRRVAQAAYDALDLRGIACVSVVLDSPRVRVLAIDPDPRLDPGSRAMAAFAAAGWSGADVRAAARGY